MSRSQNQETSESNRWLRERVADLEAEVERLTAINVERIDTHNRNLARAQTAEAEVKRLLGLLRKERQYAIEGDQRVERLREALEHVRDKSATLGDASHRARAALASLEGEDA